MSIKVNSLSGKEWYDSLRVSSDFKETFTWDYYCVLDFIEYIDDSCEGWEEFVRRVKSYGKYYDYYDELSKSKGLGRDKIYDFVVDHKDDFIEWMRLKGNDYLMKYMKCFNHNIADFNNYWFVKDDDMFMLFCTKFIEYITTKLLKFVKVNHLLN